MPMPHRTQMQLIKRRLVGKDGSARVKELRAILQDLPDYKNGPYADIRKWVVAEMDNTRRRAGVVRRDSIAVRREGAAQIALVGPPNAGKSSLLAALSDIQIRTGDYAFTTTRPVPALVRLRGVLVQLVEIPGLIAGATEDHGGGRALLGVLRTADAMVLCHAANAPLEQLHAVRAELERAEIVMPARLAVTKSDEAPPGAVTAAATAAGLPASAVSILDDRALDAFRQDLWDLTGLARVFLRRGGESVAGDPVAFRGTRTVAELADQVHHELGRECTGARVWGPSARFDGQRVGRRHVVRDGDIIELVR